MYNQKSQSFRAISSYFLQLRSIMSNYNLLPPKSVEGMTTLDREKFKKSITLPILITPVEKLNDVLKLAKTKMLKMKNFKPVNVYGKENRHKMIIIDPIVMENKLEFESFLEKVKLLAEVKLDHHEFSLNYENWKANDILQAILPTENVISSYSCIGHIVHLNLKDYNLPYKYVIGQVLLDKLENCSVVVNKTDTIDNTFRTFSMEVLAGEGDMITTIVENKVRFKFDFSKVYWNSRLSTEHERIVEKIGKFDVLLDVMAGVGPFSIPAAKFKKARVFANDLNTYSFQYLKENCALNKVKDYVECFNLDAQEFIETTVKKKLIECNNCTDFDGNVHITMNLPAKAVEFLPFYLDLIDENDLTENKFPNAIVHVYMFCKGSDKKKAVNKVIKHLFRNDLYELKHSEDNYIILKNGLSYIDFKDYIEEVTCVRNISPTQFMMRVSFYLRTELICKSSNKHKNLDSNEQPNKMLKTS